MAKSSLAFSLADVSSLSYVPQEVLSLFHTLQGQAKVLESVKEYLTDALTRKLPVQSGSLTASLTVTERRNPSWKAEFIRVTSDDDAEAVIAKTPISTSYSVKVREA